VEDSTSGVFTRSATGLVREFSALDAYFFNLIAFGFMLGSVGLLLLPVTVPGVSLVNSMVIASVLSFSVAIVYWLLIVAMPRAGGDYVTNSRILHPALGFAGNFSYAIWNVLYVALNGYFASTLGFSGFFTAAGTVTNNSSLIGLGNFFGSTAGILLTATVINILAAVITISGLRVTLRVFAVLALLGTLSWIAAVSLVALTPHSQFVSTFSQYGSYDAVVSNANSAGVFPVVSDWNQPSATVLGIGFAAVSIVFTQNLSYVGGEVKNVRKTAPIGILAALGTASLVLIFMAYSLSNTVGSQFLGSLYSLYFTGSSGYPLGSVSPSYVLFASMLASNNLPLMYFMGIGITLSVLALPVLLYVIVSRSIFAWSFDRVLPRWFSEVSNRFHTPVNSAVTIFLIAEILLFPLVYYIGQLVTLFAASTVGFVITLFLAAIAGTVLPYRKKELYNSSGIQRMKIGPLSLITAAGAVATVYIGLLIYALLSQPGFLIYNPSDLGLTAFGYLLAFSLVIVGLIIYYVSRYMRKRRGIDLNVVFREIPVE